MKRILLPFLIITVAIGVVAGVLWLRHKHAAHDSGTAALTFTGGDIVDAFQVWYQASDGQTVTYTNLDWESAARATKELENESEHSRIIERVPNFNGRGERRLITRLPEWGSGTQVMWTDDAHLFIIYASDVPHALAFEQSRVWAGNSYSVKPIPIQEYLREKMKEMKARPNKSLNRSGGSVSRIKLDPAKVTQLAPPG